MSEIPSSAIAIIGMSGRFPGAPTLDAFWRILYDGRETVSHFSADELEPFLVDGAERSDPKYVRAKGVLDGIESFDAAFFGFSPREAALTDPQHRLFLECAWETLESAGYVAERYPGAIGLYAGAGANNYLLFNLLPSGYLGGSIGAFQAMTHNKNDHLTTRTAYKLNLHGPAVTVQTACSTSLVAVHLACQSLLTYQSDMCLAGGVTISHPQRAGYLYHEGGIGSPDGHCRPFDAQAAGTVAGSGVGVVLLKRYEDALHDGDPIHALILGSAINNDGAQKVGYTAPSVDFQAEVIQMALGVAEMEAASIGYVEAHGTGTPMGDPIEMEALTRAFRASTDEKGFCALGAVKSNVGHLDTAAGVAGLIKSVLALKEGIIPPNPLFESPNPLLDLPNTPFYLPRAPQPWPSPRRAGVSSFGVGGTNAHAILQEAPPASPSDAARPPHLLLLSARSDAALEQQCVNLAAALKEAAEVNLADVAYTLQVGRKAFSHRRMMLCEDRGDAVTLLDALTPQRVFSRVQEPLHRPITFLFPGQGAQHVNMGAALYASESLFREEVERCLTLLAPHMRVSLRNVLFPPPGSEAEATAKLTQTEVAQPALFVIEYALAQLWRSWGVQPEAMIGHSIGEYVAAHLAGVFSLEDALALTALRGRLMQDLPAGAMLSVPLAEREIQSYLSPEIALAAVNGSASCVLAGSPAAMDALEARLTEQGILCTRLHTSHAFHSPMMDPILAPFVAAVRQVTLNPPQIPYLSNVSGTWITPEQATDPAYWGSHLRQTVRFADGLNHLLQEPDALLLEVGPGQTLRTLARWHPHKKPNQFMLCSLPHPREPQPERAFLLTTIGHLWLAGVELDWESFYRHETRRRVSLPTYPFERQRYWVDAPQGHASPDAALVSPDALVKKADIGAWFYVPVWQESVRPDGLAPLAAPTAPWLLFLDDAGFGARWAEHLRQTSPAQVVTVQVGPDFRQLGPDAYQLDPQQRSDYEALLAALREQNRLPVTIVHGRAIAGGGRASFDSLLYLAQAIGSQQLSEPIQLVLLSTGMQSVTGEEATTPETALLAGPCLVIPREYKHLTCRSVDLTLPAPQSWQEARLFDLLAREIAAPSAEQWVAYRSGRRWHKRWEALRLQPGAEGAMRLRQGGVYLVTGGLGGLGLTFAAWLAREARAKLVLVGRSPFPERSTWATWLESHEANDRTSAQILRLMELEVLGSEILVTSADVADAEQMAQVVSQATARFGAIHGVIHAAGVPSGGMIQLKTPAQIEKVLAPKVQGTELLGTLFAERPLDFLVLCSSLTSVVGRFGQVDYTAANAFQDAWARDYQARTGTFTVAVNWGAWDEVGMVANTPSPTKPQGKAAPVATFAHPLLGRCILDSAPLKVFATDFTVDKHWVLDEHRILGHPVIPGVTYFEMVRAAVGAEADGHALQFQDMLFLAPLRVRDGESREVRLVMERSESGYDYSVRSDEGGRERTYAAGKVRLVPAAPPRHENLEALRQRCNTQSLILPAESREEDLGPRWHSVQRVHLGTNEALVELALPDAFAADFQHMAFHPALQDRTAGIAKDFLAPKNHYLPFTYHRLTIRAPLPPRIFSHVRYLAEESTDGETIAFDILLMDEQGQVRVEIHRFAQKRVNDPAEQIRALAAALAAQAAAPAATPDAPAASAEIRPHEGAEALARILAHALMPQVVVSVRDLHASIRFTDEMVQERVQSEAPAVARPKHPRPPLATSFVAPRDEVEEQLAAIWQETLGLEQVGVHDNFFELGGDSLVGIELVTRVSKALSVQISPVSLFEGPTVAALSGLVRQSQDEVAPTFDKSRSRGDRRRAKLQSRRGTA